jgi:hypothetical protein
LEKRPMDFLESKSFVGKGEMGRLREIVRLEVAGGCPFSVGEEKMVSPDGFRRRVGGSLPTAAGRFPGWGAAGCALQPRRGGVALAGGFVEDGRSGRSGVEGLDAARHRNVDPGVGRALDFFGEARAFVADKKSNGLAPIDVPGG